MPNPFLSARISPEFHKQVEEFLARTGESKTEMLIKAVAAYIGGEIPHSKVTSDQRIDNLEQEVAQLKAAVKSLYEKIATLNPKTDNPKTEVEPIIADDKTDNTDNIQKSDEINEIFPDINNHSNNNYEDVEVEKANTNDNSIDNTDKLPDVIYHTTLTPTIDDDKNFFNIETAEVARLAKLDSKKITDLRGSFNRKRKKDNQPLPEKEILDTPIKMTLQSEIKISKIPYDIFYVGQSKEGKNLWNLIRKNSVNKQLNLLENT